MVFVGADTAFIIECSVPFLLAKTPGFSFGKLPALDFCLLPGPRHESLLH